MIKPKTLTTIVASAILAVAVSGCHYEKVKVYDQDQNGNYKVIDTQNKGGFSLRFSIPPPGYKKKCDPNSK